MGGGWCLPVTETDLSFATPAPFPPLFHVYIFTPTRAPTPTCAQILELSGNAATDNRRQRITARHISLAVAYDAELANLFQNKGTCISGGPCVRLYVWGVGLVVLYLQVFVVPLAVTPPILPSFALVGC